MGAIRISSLRTVSLSVLRERPGGMGSFEALALPCLEAPHSPRPFGAGTLKLTVPRLFCIDRKNQEHIVGRATERTGISGDDVQHAAGHHRSGHIEGSAAL